MGKKKGPKSSRVIGSKAVNEINRIKSENEEKQRREVKKRTTMNKKGKR